MKNVKNGQKVDWEILIVPNQAPNPSPLPPAIPYCYSVQGNVTLMRQDVTPVSVTDFCDKFNQHPPNYP